MVRTIILIGLIITIVLTGTMFLPGLAIEVVLASGSDVELETRQKALASTVQILLLVTVVDEQGQPVIIENGGERQMQYQSGEGLGTLARINNELVIITHDHWTLLNAQLAKARFYNAKNDLLAEVSGADFHGLIRSRDGGTMVLTAPEALFGNSSLVPAEIGNGQEAGWGEKAAVVYRNPATWELDVKVMVVVETADYQGQASYILQSAEGIFVVPGNSGGGIWLQGKLVGNMWTTMMAEGDEGGEDAPLRLSRAAQLMAAEGAAVVTAG